MLLVRMNAFVTDHAEDVQDRVMFFEMLKQTGTSRVVFSLACRKLFVDSRQIRIHGPPSTDGGMPDLTAAESSRRQSHCFAGRFQKSMRIGFPEIIKKRFFCRGNRIVLCIFSIPPAVENNKDDLLKLWHCYIIIS